MQGMVSADRPLAWLRGGLRRLRPRPPGSFTARLLVPGPVVNGRHLTGFTGRWLVSGGLIVTAIVIPRARASRKGQGRQPVSTAARLPACSGQALVLTGGCTMGS